MNENERTAVNQLKYSYFTIEARVTAWSKLPKPYEPRVKQLRGV